MSQINYMNWDFIPNSLPLWLTVINNKLYYYAWRTGKLVQVYSSPNGWTWKDEGLILANTDSILVPIDKIKGGYRAGGDGTGKSSWAAVSSNPISFGKNYVFSMYHGSLHIFPKYNSLGERIDDRFQMWGSDDIDGSLIYIYETKNFSNWTKVAELSNFMPPNWIYLSYPYSGPFLIGKKYYNYGVVFDVTIEPKIVGMWSYDGYDWNFFDVMQSQHVPGSWNYWVIGSQYEIIGKKIYLYYLGWNFDQSEYFTGLAESWDGIHFTDRGKIGFDMYRFIYTPGVWFRGTKWYLLVNEFGYSGIGYSNYGFSELIGPV